MPNRIIKESIRTSKTVNDMTDFQFRCWVYLITYVDDYGRGSADPELIKGLVFPRRKRITESDISKTLAELAGIGCVNLYEIDGEPYFYFPNWGEHQRIQTKKSKFPQPPTESKDNSPYVTVIHGESPPESNPIQYNTNTGENLLSASPTANEFFESVWILLPSHKNDVKKDVKPTRRKELQKIGYEKIKLACERYLSTQDKQFLHKRDNFFNKLLENYLDGNYQAVQTQTPKKTGYINLADLARED